MIDKGYCMSHYLAFRFVADENINFFDGLSHEVFKPITSDKVYPVRNVQDMDRVIKDKIEKFYIPGKTAVLLSGGMDSAVLASYLPAGTVAYTFKCVADGAIDETQKAKQYADKYKLDHRIIEMYWSDFEALTPEILKNDGVPFHSIEVQLLKAARLAKSQGIERFIIGESADLIFGGMDKLISQDWLLEDFKKRYNFVEPAVALKRPISVDDVYEKYRIEDKKIDFLKFMDEVFSIESSTSYMHAFKMAGISYLDPYAYMTMAEPLDLKRVRSGEPKYLVRELFASKYPEIPVPDKIPMPRATEQWLKDYKPVREEFISGCEKEMTGDQKWLLYCLEMLLNMHDEGVL